MTSICLFLQYSAQDYNVSICECTQCGWITQWQLPPLTNLANGDRQQGIGRVTAHARTTHDQVARLVMGVRP